MRSSIISLLLLLQLSILGLGEIPGFGDSASISFDTRDTAQTDTDSSTLSAFDTRVILGLYFSAESGDTTLDTGGSIGMPFLTGVLGPVQGSDQRQWITLRGSGFRSDSVVILRTGTETFTIPAGRTFVSSTTEIRVFVNLTTVSAEWTAQVVNPGRPPSALTTFVVGSPAVRPDPGQDYGLAMVGETAARTFIVRNNGETEVYGSATASSPFSVTAGASYTLAPGAEQTVTITYSPTTEARHERIAIFNVGNQSIGRTLSGRAIVSAPSLGSIIGTLKTAEGNALAGSKIRVTLPAAGEFQSVGADVFSDSQGYFTVPGLTPDTYTLHVKPKDGDQYQGTQIVVNVTAGSTSSSNLQLSSLPPSSSDDPYVTPIVLIRGFNKYDAEYWAEMKTALADFAEVWDGSVP